MTPIDVIKTRIQIDPALKGNGMLAAGRTIIAAEGAKGLLTGFGPTAAGYLVQGGAKFAGYEFFKKCVLAGALSLRAEHRLWGLTRGGPRAFEGRASRPTAGTTPPCRTAPSSTSPAPPPPSSLPTSSSPRSKVRGDLPVH
jgi:hypothetical protein